MHNSDNTVNFSAAISSPVRVLKSLSFDTDLKSASLHYQSVQKLPQNFKDKMHWFKPTLLDFNNWQKKELHVLMEQNANKAKPGGTCTSVTKAKTASKIFASNSQQRETKKERQPSSTKA